MHFSVDRPGRAVVPFLLVGLAGLMTLLFPPFADKSYDLWVGGTGLLATAVLGAVSMVIPKNHWAAGAPPLLFFGVVAVARDASGGANSGVTPLILLPVLWIVLYGTAAQLKLAAVAAGAVFVVPLILAGAPRYDPREWRTAVIWVLVIVVICPTLQRGVHRLREAMRAEKLVAAELAAVLRAATEHAIIATDLDGTITLFSEGAERLLGYSAGELVGSGNAAMLYDRAALNSRTAELGAAPGFLVW